MKIRVAKKIPIAETNKVFKSPTRNALAYDIDPSQSISEKPISKEAS